MSTVAIRDLDPSPYSGNSSLQYNVELLGLQSKSESVSESVSSNVNKS